MSPGETGGTLTIVVSSLKWGCVSVEGRGPVKPFSNE